MRLRPLPQSSCRPSNCSARASRPPCARRSRRSSRAREVAGAIRPVYIGVMRTSRLLSIFLALVCPVAISAQPAPQKSRVPFEVAEASISEIHAAMRAGTLTCRELVNGYLARIATYDKNGPAINALIVVNPAALATADSLDKRFASGGPVGPLHCIPMIVKDNFETRDLPTTAGSLSLSGMVPQQDAFMVRRIREAGAIGLAKSNMGELAFPPYETVSSILPGYTKNPYALDRATPGSSGGSAGPRRRRPREATPGARTGEPTPRPSAPPGTLRI